MMAVKGCFSVSQVSAGRKNRLSFEVNGSECSLGWDQEVPQTGLATASSLTRSDRRPRADVAGCRRQRPFPGGHIEGWPDAFKNMMLNFYRAVDARGAVNDGAA
jgi:predicted dehydrogenase